VRPGSLVAIVSEQPEESAVLADRLGMCAPDVDDEVRLGGVPLGALRRAEVRRRIVVSDTGAQLFSGRLGDRLDLTGTGDVSGALDTTSSADILESLPDGLDTVVAERGRTFSGGQRQRLVLTRVLTLDPEILVLVEPTSAVDAHTEARIATRLRDHRAGRTTVVTTSSPLMLDAMDEVAFLRDGRVVSTGRHQDLLDNDPTYRRVVIRESEVTAP
jgi:ABC-type multidrug transport system fused ATPase/permease subunit